MDANPEKVEENGRIQRLRAFLLGTLAEAEVERVEYDVLSDERLYEHLVATEEELIDEYLSGSLTPNEASSFLGYLDKLPGGSQRIDFARNLGRSLRAPDRSDPTASRWQAAVQAFSRTVRWNRSAWAGAALLAVLALGSQLWRTSSEPQVVLTAGRVRGEGVSTVTLRSSSPVVTVTLELGASSHDRYRATLLDSESRPLFSAGGLVAAASDRRILVPFPFPVTGVEPGDYSISLDGETTSGSYEPVAKYGLRLVD